MWSPGDHALATVTIPTVNTSDITGTSFPRFMSHHSLIGPLPTHPGPRRTGPSLARERAYGPKVSRKHAEDHVADRRALVKTLYGVAIRVVAPRVPRACRRKGLALIALGLVALRSSWRNSRQVSARTL